VRLPQFKVPTSAGVIPEASVVHGQVQMEGRQEELGVDDASSRPRGLYERLGYVVSGSEIGSWDVDAPDGSVSRYETTITLLRKELRQL
jgi:hypothetical protein